MYACTTIGDGRYIERWVHDKLVFSSKAVIAVDQHKHTPFPSDLPNTDVIYYQTPSAPQGFDPQHKHKVAGHPTSILMGIQTCLEQCIQSNHNVMLFLDSDVFVNGNHALFVSKITESLDHYDVVGVMIPTVTRDQYDALLPLPLLERVNEAIRRAILFRDGTNFAMKHDTAKTLLEHIDELIPTDKPPDLELWRLIKELGLEVTYIDHLPLSHIVLDVEITSEQVIRKE